MHTRIVLLSLALLIPLCFLPVPSVEATTMWSQTYGGIGDEVAYSIVETSDGGYAVAGVTGPGSFNIYGPEFWLICLTDFSAVDASWMKPATRGNIYGIGSLLLRG